MQILNANTVQEIMKHVLVSNEQWVWRKLASECVVTKLMKFKQLPDKNLDRTILSTCHRWVDDLFKCHFSAHLFSVKSRFERVWPLELLESSLCWVQHYQDENTIFAKPSLLGAFWETFFWKSTHWVFTKIYLLCFVFYLLIVTLAWNSIYDKQTDQPECYVESQNLD